MNPAWIIHTGRLILTPVSGGDLAELRALKADPAVFAVMLGGVRDHAQTAADLADNVVAWGRYGFGIWALVAGYLLQPLLTLLIGTLWLCI